jgi:uncharacterized protein YjiK
MLRVVPRLAFRQGRTRRLPIGGASAVAATRGMTFLAEDDEGIFRLRGGRCSLWAGRSLHPALGDLEGIALDEGHGRLWAVAEESGEVVELSLGTRRPVPRSIGCLPRPGGRANKGYEGLSYLPRAVSPNRCASLVAVHEGKPRRVAVFALPGLEETHHFKLPGNAKDALHDLADVTVDPKTGLLLLLSEESRRIGVFAMNHECLSLIDLFDVRVDRKARPEGLAFVTPARLLVVTEGPATAIEFRVTREP